MFVVSCLFSILLLCTKIKSRDIPYMVTIKRMSLDVGVSLKDKKKIQRKFNFHIFKQLISDELT